MAARSSFPARHCPTPAIEMISADIDPTARGNTRRPPRQSQKNIISSWPSYVFFIFFFIFFICLVFMHLVSFHCRSVPSRRLHFFFVQTWIHIRLPGAESRCRNRRISQWSVGRLDFENALGKPPSTQYTARMNISFHRDCADMVRCWHKNREMKYSVLNLVFD